MNKNIILNKQIGKNLNSSLLEWFYFEQEPVSIIRLYLLFDEWISVMCSEETIKILQLADKPYDWADGDYKYIMVAQDIKNINKSKLKDIKYLIDKHDIKRGILFLFENGNNLCYFNRGYEFKEETIFKINIQSNEITSFARHFL
ncbi:hypothetical protein AGMMS50239_16220 [Bacteroidia bacterium]|nr:hypothetical protein AGMMS50239_16220 [Bacteroidia bacterium]